MTSIVPNLRHAMPCRPLPSLRSAAISPSKQEPSLTAQTARRLQSNEFVLKTHILHDSDFQIIRTAALSVPNGAVDDIVHSLQSNPSCSSIYLTPHLIDGLLHRSGDDWKAALAVFQWARSRPGYQHTHYACDKVVDLLGRARQFHLMSSLVREIHSLGLVTLATVAKVMRRFAGAGRWRDVVKMFDELPSLGLEKNAESMNLLLDTLCKGGKPEVAREVLTALRDDVAPNAYTFNILVHGWCIVRRLDEAEWTVREMKGCGFRPSVITYSTIVQACCARFDFEKVYDRLDEMQAEGCAPNVITYTIVMNFLAKARRIDDSVGILERMRVSGCKPDVLFYNSLINVLGKAGRVEEAVRVFQIDMQVDGVAHNLLTYNMMISIFCHHGQEQAAFDILKEMENSSCRPDLLTYTPLLKYCLAAEKEDLLRSLMSDVVNKHHLSFDLSLYSLLIHGLCKIGKIEWACLLFGEMIDREILPRTRTCELLLKEAGQNNPHGIIERIKSVLKQIEASCR